MGLIAITNPSDEAAEAGIVNQEASVDELTPAGILKRYGSKLEDGAQVTMVENGRVWQYIATRDDELGSVALRSNNALAASKRVEGEKFIDYANDVPDAFKYIIEVTDAELESAVELETFTVFGKNDDAKRFVAVVSATEDTVHEVGIQAGLVDEGYEEDVRIDLILRGDCTEDAVSI